MSFVYYGSVDSMIDGQSMSHLHQVASFDRYNNQFELINFYVNDDAECKMKHKFTTFEPAIALYVHPQVVPFTLQMPAEELKMEAIVNWISVSLIQFSLRWGGRA